MTAVSIPLCPFVVCVCAAMRSRPPEGGFGARGGRGMRVLRHFRYLSMYLLNARDSL